jgi:DUF2075 family protein
MQQSTNQILLIDSEQSIMPADLTLKAVKDLEHEAKDNHSYFKLMSQLRVKGGDEYISQISQLLSGTESLTRTSFDGYDFRIFEDFNDMVREIKARDTEVGLSRVVAGYAWKWVTKGLSDPNVFDIEIQGTKLSWNKTALDWINTSSSLNEVGSIHTVQGYDLNYCGVIIGRDLYFDEDTQKIRFDRSNYFDMKGMEGNRRLGRYYSDDEIETYVKQIYRVLLTRGIFGTYVYVCEPKLRKYLSELFSIQD